MTTGPGRPVRAISKAVRTVASSRAGSVTRKQCFATAPMMLLTGASWNASLPIAAVGTWPQITTMGTASAAQSRTGVTVLVAPGPDVTTQTPTLPLARAYPAAMNPAPCSLAGTINGIGVPRPG